MEKVWLYAAIGGFFPIIFWLFFWFREDLKDPEPKWLIAKTFLFGIAAAFISLLVEAFIHTLHLNNIDQTIAFSFAEEFLKFLAVFAAALGTVWVNEREDPMLYMITGALGFAAVENTFYIIDYLDKSEYIRSLIDGGYRFIGATLLHTITSAIIGIFISVVFFQSWTTRILSSLLGLLVATGIHTVFNLMVNSTNIFYKSTAFWTAWIGIVILLFIFQIIESMPNPYQKHKEKILKQDTKFRKIFF